jgi:hypothetical protein
MAEQHLTEPEQQALRSEWLWDQSRAPDLPPIGRGGASTDEVLAKQRARDERRARERSEPLSCLHAEPDHGWAERMIAAHQQASRTARERMDHCAARPSAIAEGVPPHTGPSFQTAATPQPSRNDA